MIVNLRRWHRWVSAVLGVFLLLMAVTGIGIQATDLLRGTGRAKERVAATMAPPPAKAPERKTTTWNHWLKKVHSGEQFGPVGVAVSIASGVALLFFAISGIWMYLAMFLRRARSGLRDPFWR